MKDISNSPKYALGALTNFGRVVSYYYLFASDSWVYSFQIDETFQSRDHKLEEQVFLVEAPDSTQLQPDYSLGKTIGDRGFVAGVAWHSSQRTFSYFLSRGKGSLQSSIYWHPEESLKKYLAMA